MSYLELEYKMRGKMNKIYYPSDVKLHNSTRMADSLSNLKYSVIIHISTNTDNIDNFVDLMRQAIINNIDDYFYFDFDPKLRWITATFTKPEHLTLFKISKFFVSLPDDIKIKEIETYN